MIAAARVRRRYPKKQMMAKSTQMAKNISNLRPFIFGILINLEWATVSESRHSSVIHQTRFTIL